jgi:signal transduction histidine kinase
LNQLWDGLAPKQEISAEVRTVFYLVENELRANPDSFFPQQVSSQLSDEKNSLQIELLSLDDIAKSSAMKKLIQGGIVTASTDHQLLWYKRFADSHQVIMLSKTIETQQESLLTTILLILFYLGLALVIYIWVWPLSRDAKKLEQQTQSLGAHQVPDVLTLSTRSTLYPLARAFNNMVHRLRDLITSHHDMTNAVSHELRTPLARMKFALAMIDTKILDEKSRQQLNSLTLDIGEMESLINSLLIYAGFEQQTRKLQFTQGKIRDLLDNLQERFIRTHQLKSPQKLQLELKDLSNGIDFACEWKLIETALQNLLSNAARFAVNKIRIEACIENNQFQIRVDDNGPGIPVEERQRVMESFVRLYDEQNEIQSSGFGLGLAIVKRIMQWHDGGVMIEQAPELGGARLILYWPKNNNSN